MKTINHDRLRIAPLNILDKRWALLVAGVEKPNLMTVSWGGFGTLWHKPCVTVYVRPTRHTFGLLEAHPEFTLNFLPESLRGAMDLCGTRSGREMDKWSASGLHPERGEAVAVPRVREAVLSLECRVMAWQDFDPARFLSADISSKYPERDYHRIFFGEPLRIFGEEAAMKDF